MAEFGIVDLTAPSDAPTSTTQATVSGQSAGGWLGSVDTAVVASALESLREDLAAHIKSEKSGLRLSSLTVKLTLSAEGKVAFVVKGSAEACIEVVFAASSPKGS